MADIVDEAQEREENYRAGLLRLSHQRAKVAKPSANGRCFHCDEPVAGDKRWCDTECRDAWESDRSPSSLSRFLPPSS